MSSGVVLSLKTIEYYWKEFTTTTKHPDSNKPYTLFTDASKHGCACVLRHEFKSEVNGKVLKELHPVAYISGLFQGSQVAS